MERLFLECTVRVFLLISATAILLHIMRVKDAAAKHRVWTGVMALMLLLPVWATWGPKVSLRVLPPLPRAMSHGPIVTEGSLQAPVAQKLSSGELLLASAYLVGFCVLVLRLAVGTIHTRRLIRYAVLQDGVRTSPLCASPVTVGFFCPMVIFPENWREWEQSKLNSISAHEEEHARRRDSLLQWFALLNRAVFWFHPAAWWLERTLSGLAEEACDNAVLARGNNAREYAACLVELARSVSRSGARLNIVGMAVPGGLLRERLRKIIEIGPRPRISGSWMGCVAVVCAITCAIAVAGTVEHAETKIPLTNQTARSENPKAVAEQPSRPSCRYCPNPEFPDEAKKAKISSASALVEITVSEKGDVDAKNIRVIEDPGHGFAQEAVAVVKKWKFNPATLKDGKPTKTRTTVEVQFTRHSD